nr:hypothetical protein [Tanacetum cinerariifolium]
MNEKVQDQEQQFVTVTEVVVSGIGGWRWCYRIKCLGIDSSFSGRGERKPRKEQNRIKTGQKRETWRSREKFKAVSVERGRKTKENKKGMAENAYTYQKLFKFKEKKKRKGPEMKFFQSTTTGAKADSYLKLWCQGRAMQQDITQWRTNVVKWQNFKPHKD